MSTPIAPRAAGGRSLRGHRRALQLPRLPTRGGPRPRTELSAIPRASIARIFVIRDENTNRRCNDPPVRARTSRAGFAAVGVLIAATVFFAFTARGARGTYGLVVLDRVPSEGRWNADSAPRRQRTTDVNSRQLVPVLPPNAMDKDRKFRIVARGKLLRGQRLRSGRPRPVSSRCITTTGAKILTIWRACGRTVAWGIRPDRSVLAT